MNIFCLLNDLIQSYYSLPLSWVSLTSQSLLLLCCCCCFILPKLYIWNNNQITLARTHSHMNEVISLEQQKRGGKSESNWISNLRANTMQNAKTQQQPETAEKWAPYSSVHNVESFFVSFLNPPKWNSLWTQTLSIAWNVKVYTNRLLVPWSVRKVIKPLCVHSFFAL